MRFIDITTAILATFAATSVAFAAPTVDDTGDFLSRRFADAVYARGVHDGLQARDDASRQGRLVRRARSGFNTAPARPYPAGQMPYVHGWSPAQ
ncbi:hypothetical protein EIP91_002999 [Steccherinum ochraceum]|uniref:Uncharacterized protein n=1 Tax=Steccherinum ochraceum TaxID=92696 RepID=A0A4V6N751_9APHY|nr:hypothetical protein EIP91_002999 [Steccherinum ochraceum]